MSTLTVNPDGIPVELKQLDQWVVWCHEERGGKATKVPYSPDGKRLAKTNDPGTWGTFAEALAKYQSGSFAGIGFVFTAEADIVGIDLDGCRDAETGEFDNWALPTLTRFNSYTEVSPSGNGVKMFMLGNLPTNRTGEKIKASPADLRRGGKTPGIEVYQRGRYFAVTGHALPDFADHLVSYRDELPRWFKETFRRKQQPAQPKLSFTFAGSPDGAGHLIERAKAYLRKLPPAVSGERGHDRAFHAACILLCDFGLPPADAWAAIQEWNQTCDPPWSDAELRHKFEDASKQPVTNRLRGGHPVSAVQQAATGEPYEIPLMTFAELDQTTDEIDYLIDGLLVAGQPGGIFGGKKSLKTNIALDLAESLAIGGRFLNTFQVTRPIRVAVLSGESGQPTLRETARRIARSKGRLMVDFGNALIGYRLPNLGSLEQITALEHMIARYELQVVVIDPAYLCMNVGDGAANLFVVGVLLAGLTYIGQKTGCCILLIHHTKKGKVDPFAPPELEDIAWSGFQEWSRQWLLIGRRERYDPNNGGSHQLWLNVGGSAGHSGLWGIDIDEGTRQDIGGRRWDVTIVKAFEARSRAAEAIDEARDKVKATKASKRLAESRQRILSVLRKCPDGETKNVIESTAGLNQRDFLPAIDAMLEDGQVEVFEVTKGNRRHPGYRLRGQSDKSDK
jgi:hypothetical protein